MKKLLFMAAMAAVSVFTAKAQNNEMPTATLQHGDQTLVFTGKTAFQSAYEAAADSGDVIILSSGRFTFSGDNNNLTISKSLSVYGAGFENDTITGTTSTIISVDKGTMYLGSTDLTSEDEDGNIITRVRNADFCHFEGFAIGNDGHFSVKSHIKNITMTKLGFGTLGISQNYPVDNIAIRQCHFFSLSCGPNTAVANLYISNSHLSTAYLRPNITGKMDHCIATSSVYGGSWFVSNSILYQSLEEGSTATNNIFVGLNSSVGGGVQNMGTNWTGVANAGIWAKEGEDGSYAEDKTFELKYPDKYVGTDGTQVGLHGGDYPWNKIPSTPRIVESNIDTKTSADGKLKVSIKVEAQTKE